VNAARRHMLALLAAAPALARADIDASAADDDRVRRGRELRFPRDHGAHLGARTEWWYATGWLAADGASAPTHGFQVTFFRSRTGLAEGLESRFAARQLLFAHAAVTDLAAKKHRHAQRIARWTGDPSAPLAHAALADCDVRLGGWALRRESAGGTSRYRTRVASDDFRLELMLTRSQPLLLQGEAGFSRKGPDESEASHYYSEPQLMVQGELALAGAPRPVRGSAWLDHEWSEQILHPEAVGWDWIGINLQDGSALTAFRLRRADGSALWAGGSFRAAGGPVQSFGPDAVRFVPGRVWVSPGSGARYPVAWQVETPAGRFGLRSLLDAQELDGRGGTGAIYWEGLSELLDSQGARVGLGYLEMTGYAAPLKLG